MSVISTLANILQDYLFSVYPKQFAHTEVHTNQFIDRPFHGAVLLDCVCQISFFAVPAGRSRAHGDRGVSEEAVAKRRRLRRSLQIAPQRTQLVEKAMIGNRSGEKDVEK